MKFALLGYSLEQNWGAMSKGEQDAMLEDCFSYDSKLVKDGHMIDDGAALRPGPETKTLRLQKGAVVVTDGPFTETKEQLGGIGVVEARDMDHAVELMSKHPALHYGSTFELRPIDEDSLKRQAASIANWRAAGTAPPVAADAVRFASLGYIDESAAVSKSKGDFEAMMKQCIAFDEERVRSGQWLSGIGLQSARTAKTLRVKAGQVIVSDGPFAETKEYLGGVVVLAFKDLTDAIAMLSKHPALPFGVAIEIRPIDEEINKRWEAKIKPV